MSGILKIFQKHKIIPRVLLHILYWVAAFSFYVFYFGHGKGNYNHTFLFVLSLMPITIATCYFVLYFILPRYAYNPQKRSVPFLIYLGIMILMVHAYLSTLVIAVFMVRQVLNIGLQSPTGLDMTTIDIAIVVFSMLFAVILAVAIKLFKYWFHEKDQARELMKEKVQAELKMLKMQLNPHFLFNTLNSIYSLALTNSKDTPDVVLKLSAMLDYILYDCKADKVLLAKEIQFLQNYIAMEKLRFGDRVNVRFDSNAPKENISIPPMLLVPFVDNSFKHGAAKSTKQSQIDIAIFADQTRLEFQITNTIPNRVEGPEKKTGIGLESVRKQLELLYPDTHQLNIAKQNDHFTVELTIPVGP